MSTQVKRPRAKSVGEETFALQLRAERFPIPSREYEFASPRKYRFDFAWPAPSLKIAVEIEGGIGGKSRHSSVIGFDADCEKYNLATMEGWKVFRFSTRMVKNGSAIVTMAVVFRYYP